MTERTPEYEAWCSMKSRCSNPSNPEYHKNGAIGIRVCEEWLDNFQAFLTEVGPKPGPGCCLTRIDLKLDFKPGNVTWVSKTEHQRWTSRNIMVTYRGETKPLPDWCESLGLSYETTKKRISRGWSAEEAFATPISATNATTRREVKRKATR